MVNLVPIPACRTCVFRTSTRNNAYQDLSGLYVGGMFSEDQWKIAVCRAFNSFRVTDSLTSLTE